MNPESDFSINYLSWDGADESVEVMLDTTEYTAKPTDGRTPSNCVARGRTRITIRTLVEKITKGCTHCFAACRDKKRTNATWEHQLLFGVDFDKGWTLEHFEEHCNKYCIAPSFIYPSFRHTDDAHRFRAVFIMDRLVTDYHTRTLIAQCLYDLFTLPVPGGDPIHPDESCLDGARMFYGTDKPLICADFKARTNPYHLLECVLNKMKEEDPAHFAENERTLLSLLNIELTHDGNVVQNFGAVSENPSLRDFTVSSYCYKEDAADSHPFSTSIIYNDHLFRINWTCSEAEERCKKEEKDSKKTGSQKSKKSRRLKGVKIKKKQLQPPRRISDEEFDILYQKCRLYREFMDGERYVHHNERFLLLTNLRYLVGGRKRFKEGLSKRDDYNDPCMMSDVDRANYKPKQCKYCGYDRCCDHKSTLLQQLPLKRHECRQEKESPPAKKLHYSRAELGKAMKQCIESEDTKIYVVKCDTGVGKTEVVLKQDLSGTCMGFPTHALKAEAHQRLMDNGQHVYLWPKPPDLPAELAEELARRHAKGIGGTTEIYRRAMDHKEIREDFDRLAEIAQYIEALSEVYRQTSVFTTQEKAYQLQTVSGLRTFIFDEDFATTLVRVEEIPLSAIREMMERIDKLDSAEYADILSHLQEVYNSPQEMNHRLVDKPHYSQSVLHSLIAQMPNKFLSPMECLFTCELYRKELDKDGYPNSIWTICKRNLAEDKKFIVLSATANEEVYRALFHDRLVFIDLSGTELKGQIICHTRHSFSKSQSLDSKHKTHKKVQSAKEKYGFDGIITHKCLAKSTDDGKHLLKAPDIPVFATFGGLLGLDSLQDKNFAVVGTPYPPEPVTKLWAGLLGFSDTEDDFEFCQQDVEFNEYRVNLPVCSDDPRIQALNLWLIHSELVQAVGRARLVSNARKLHVFAKLPISGCKLMND